MIGIIGSIFAIIIFIPAPILFGIGFSSLANKRNTGGNALINGTFQDDFQHCFASTTFSNITKNITIPCQSDNVTGLLIPICYNRHNLNDYAYADHNQHGDGYYTNNPYNFCADVGYRSAKNMVLAGYIFCGISFFIIIATIINSVIKSKLRR